MGLLKTAALIYLGYYLAKHSIPGEAELQVLVDTNKKLLATLAS